MGEKIGKSGVEVAISVNDGGGVLSGWCRPQTVSTSRRAETMVDGLPRAYRFVPIMTGKYF